MNEKQKNEKEAKQQFEDDFKQTDHLASIFADMSDEEMLIGELARLQTILMILEDKEEYEKAAIILKKIDKINKKLNDGSGKY